MALRTKQVTMIEVSDWDELVVSTYGRPYNFQQQDDCKARGTESFSVPEEWDEDYENDTIPEEINGSEMGVSFKAWQKRNPEALINGEGGYNIGLFWDRNFYPCLQVVANDLHKRGLLPAGDYTINIDW